MRHITEQELVDLLGNIADGERWIVAVTGPPGSGKSTLAEKIETVLNAKTPGYAAVFPMDGYHFDDQVLIPRGLRPRKGAPETFDVELFSHMLDRLRGNAVKEIALPVFDRSLEIARAGARIIPQSVRLVLVEGNYLLLDRDGWNALTFDTTMMLDVPRETLRQRLMKRWTDHGKSSEEIAQQVDSNDMLNVDLVQTSSRLADYGLRF